MRNTVLDGLMAVVLICWTAWFSVKTWIYYQEHPELLDRDNWTTLGLLTLGIVLAVGGYFAVTKDRNGLGFMLAVVGTVLVVLAIVYRMETTTIWLGVIILSGVLTLAAAYALATDRAGGNSATPREPRQKRREQESTPLGDMMHS